VIRTGVPQEQVRQIHRKERVLRRATGLRRDRPVRDHPIAETTQRRRVGLVLVGPELLGLRGGNHARDQFLHGLPCGLRIGPPKTALEFCSFAPLCGAHRAASAQFCIVETINVVRASDQEIEVKRPVLTRLEASEAIEDDNGFGGSRSALFMKEQAMASQAIRLTQYRLMRDPELRRNLSQSRTAEQAVEEVSKQLRTPQPVGGMKGL
jgi:hypothetical protein